MTRLSRLLAVAALAITAGCAGSDGEISCADFRFDQQGWAARDSVDGNPSARQRMADHIAACRSFHGKRYSKVRKLLGAPYAGRGGSRHVVWMIGEERGLFSMDSEYLDLEFRRRRVVGASVG